MTFRTEILWADFDKHSPISSNIPNRVTPHSYSSPAPFTLKPLRLKIPPKPLDNSVYKPILQHPFLPAKPNR